MPLHAARSAHPNHVWSTDISYVAMEHGFMYLYAVIDVYSRCIVGWGLYNTLDASNSIEVLERAIKAHGAPEIINSDQGCQYTSKEWLEACASNEIKVTRASGTRSRLGSMRWPNRKERYGNIKKNNYLRSTVQNAEHHLSGGFCSEERLT